MASTRFLSLAEILALHDEVMRRTGGEPRPPRTLDGLASAQYRTVANGYQAGDLLIRQAAMIAVGLSRERVFPDGNKRTGYYAAITFLNLNGLRCTGNALAGARLLDELTDPSVGEDEADERFEMWLRAHVTH